MSSRKKMIATLIERAKTQAEKEANLLFAAAENPGMITIKWDHMKFARPDDMKLLEGQKQPNKKKKDTEPATTKQEKKKAKATEPTPEPTPGPTPGPTPEPCATATPSVEEIDSDDGDDGDAVSPVPKKQKTTETGDDHSSPQVQAVPIAASSPAPASSDPASDQLLDSPEAVMSAMTAI